LLVEKIGRNTLDVLNDVARAAGARPRDVGYCGLKDRHAVTRQWLSIPLDRARERDALVPGLSGDGWRVTEVTRNQRKLRLGAHRYNRFVITLRELEGDVAPLAERIERARTRGVPNYFGAQRFGHDGDNLRRARRWFVDGVDLGRRQRRFALSAARSWVFNRVLADRVADGSWDTPMDGEPLCLAGSRSFFLPEAWDDTLEARFAAHDVHTSGPLVGRGDSPAVGDCAAFEASASAELGWVVAGLAAEGLKSERRALRLSARDLDYELGEDSLRLSFTLGRGCFATAVVRELLEIVDDRVPA
ncbi:MAG: tRNA pseudouridine(13) synthase TruD, partial [Pseudomonadota bacterium]